MIERRGEALSAPGDVHQPGLQDGRQCAAHADGEYVQCHRPGIPGCQRIQRQHQGGPYQQQSRGTHERPIGKPRNDQIAGRHANAERRQHQRHGCWRHLRHCH
jgi:hypothetical protein